MKYFYIIVNLNGRVGFGITGNPRRRLKDYTGSWGELASFTYLFSGSNAHIIALENIVKRMHSDIILNIEDWRTEWLVDDYSLEDFYNLVTNDIIDYQHLPITLHAENVEFSNDLTESF